ncbi:unnamed protein product [Angiostrongylus costaricensis]|uniref:Uncharacterized protein n=1 Tax=Angiostrongylus costaricensis TaxID=334426 RepID=A0A0R3PYJ0_ANGCS|nr:unnamed protein product [Angiostrongylus costaricensis]
MKEVRSARDPEYKTLDLDISEWESVKIVKRSEINPKEILKTARSTTLLKTRMYSANLIFINIVNHQHYLLQI